MTSSSAETRSSGTSLSIAALLLGIAALVLAVFPDIGLSMLNLKGVGWGVVVAVLPTVVVAVASGWTAYRGFKASSSKKQRIPNVVAATLAGLAMVIALMFLTLGIVGALISS
jgi:hypothetical protein